MSARFGLLFDVVNPGQLVHHPHQQFGDMGVPSGGWQYWMMIGTLVIPEIDC